MICLILCYFDIIVRVGPWERVLHHIAMASTFVYQNMSFLKCQLIDIYMFHNVILIYSHLL